MSEDARLAELLLRWEEQKELGRPVCLESLCRDAPELLDELRRQVGLLRGMATLLDLDAAAPPPEPPPAVPGFEILSRLGDGGMGVVYRARDLNLDVAVAIKVPRRAALLRAGQRERFRREARVLAQLRHPNIVSIHAADLHNGRPYFVMDYVAGGSLAARMADFAGDPAGAAALLEKVARAVEYAHGRNVLHRDLKPANILLDEHGQPRVADFGIAAVRDGDAPTPPSGAVRPYGGTSLTRTGMAVGTPLYMAPEQLGEGAGQASPATDVWALGVILYEMLTGRHPFRAGQGTGPEEVIRPGQPPQPRDLCRGLDRRLEVIVLRCLEKDPSGRYPTAGALADALAAWRERRVGTPWRRTLRRINRRPWVVAVGCSFAATAALAVFLLPPRWRETAPPDADTRRQDRGIAARGDKRFNNPSKSPAAVPKELPTAPVLSSVKRPDGRRLELLADGTVWQISADGQARHLIATRVVSLVPGFRPDNHKPMPLMLDSEGRVFGCTRGGEDVFAPQGVAALEEGTDPKTLQPTTLLLDYTGAVSSWHARGLGTLVQGGTVSLVTIADPATLKPTTLHLDLYGRLHRRDGDGTLTLEQLGVVCLAAATDPKTLKRTAFRLCTSGAVDKHTASEWATVHHAGMRAIITASGSRGLPALFGLRSDGVLCEYAGGKDWVPVKKDVADVVVAPDPARGPRMLFALAGGEIQEYVGDHWISIKPGGVRAMAAASGTGGLQTLFALTKGGSLCEYNGGTTLSPLETGVTDIGVAGCEAARREVLFTLSRGVIRQYFQGGWTDVNKGGVKKIVAGPGSKCLRMLYGLGEDGVLAEYGWGERPTTVKTGVADVVVAGNPAQGPSAVFILSGDTVERRFLPDNQLLAQHALFHIRGRHWEPVTKGVRAIAAAGSTRGPVTLFALGKDGVLREFAGGTRWTTLKTGVKDLTADSLPKFP
jgi:serine/threonine protein kinase